MFTWKFTVCSEQTGNAFLANLGNIFVNDMTKLVFPMLVNLSRHKMLTHLGLFGLFWSKSVINHWVIYDESAAEKQEMTLL